MAVLHLPNQRRLIFFKLHIYETFQPHSDIVDIINLNAVETYLNSSLQLTLIVKSFNSNDIKYNIQNYLFKWSNTLMIS